MDNNQKPQKSIAKDSKPMIKARVKSHYAGARPGEIVEVTASELKLVPHALISLEDEARAAEEAAKPKALTSAQRSFRMTNAAMVAASKAQQEARKELMKKHLDSLGVKAG